MEIGVANESKDILGEGPIWSVKEKALYWVDIERKYLQCWFLQTKKKKKWVMPTEIGSFVFCKNGDILVALRSNLSILNPNTGELTSVAEIPTTRDSIRFNDGKCDRKGRFWVGTMDEENPDMKRGSLYCLDTNHVFKRVLSNIGISNGLGWSPDNMVFYYTDSTDKTIWAYDYELSSGNISNQRVFVEILQEYVPDGLTVDSEGCVWSAKWDGWKVVRYNPEGSIDSEVRLPIQRPTSCTFGKSSYDTLFITSASIGLSEEEKKKQALAGSLFMVELGIKGIPEPMFGL